MAFASLFIRTTSREVAMTVTVFTKPHCPQCDATKRQLTKLGVPFETVDLTQNPSTLEQLAGRRFPAGSGGHHAGQLREPATAPT